MPERRSAPLLELLPGFQTLQFGCRALDLNHLLNALNHVSFSTPGTDPYSSAFGVITSQRGLARRVRLGLKGLY
jgi:hypothetical protein